MTVERSQLTKLPLGGTPSSRLMFGRGYIQAARCSNFRRRAIGVSSEPQPIFGHAADMRASA